MDINLNWVPQRLEDLIPEQLRESFHRQVIEPAAREDETQRTAERRRFQSEVDKISAEIVSCSPLLTTAKEKEIEAERDLRQAEVNLRIASVDRERVQFTLLDLRGKLETLKSKIAKNCSPELDTFTNDHLKLFDKVRNEIRVEERLSEPQRLSGIRTPLFHSNKADVERTIDKIRNALDAAAKLRSENLSDAEVKKRLGELRVVDPRGYKFETIKMKNS